MYYWEKLISNLAFFDIHILSVDRVLTCIHFQVSKIFVNNIILNSIASEPAWEKPN